MVLRGILSKLVACLSLIVGSECADLVIRIPGDLSQQDGFYRLNYQPNTGFPAANTTFRPKDISEVIEFSEGLPGTKYDFQLYYSNSTISDWLSWTASITTVPDPPSNLSIQVVSGKIALIDWDPPKVGGHSGFKLKVIPLSEPSKSVRSIVIRQNSSPFQLRDLSPGATYEVQLFTVYENKDSTVYISTNFTTTPNTPGRFIVWFRNETTLLVLWQPPYPAGVYTDYKVSIDPPDAEISETYVPKEGEPPGPAQAAFNGLIPGRAYNISVETVSESKISEPTTAQYRTVPWRPHNVTFDLDSIEPYSFRVRWSGPRELTEFDRYQVAIGIRRKTPQIIERGKRPLEAKFVENLQPGVTYQVVVKTVSGSVASWPATGNVTTRPLPVQNIQTITDHSGKEAQIIWEPDAESNQDSYKITYHELETFNGDSSSIEVGEPSFSLDDNLQPGRNYSVSIQAVSKGIASKPKLIYQPTSPASPIIEDVEPISYGLNISWKSDVTSKQERYAVVYNRNDTNQSTTIETREPKITLANLYPGAGYEIKVYAVNHGLRSEPHNLFTAVYPNPPRNLTLSLTEQNKILLSWLEPENSIFTNYIIRYRPYGNERTHEWFTIDGILKPQYELTDLIPGENFEIHVDSVSHHVESRKPLIIKQTIPPKSINEITPILEAENITLSWQKPFGHIDYYHIRWHPLSNPEDIREKRIKGTWEDSGSNFFVVIRGLHPGVEYNFEVSTESHKLGSKVKNISVRTKPLITSELTILNKKDLTTSLTLLYTETPLTKSLFDTYRFQLGNQIKEKAAQDSDRRLTFSNLIPGRLYNITLWTVSGGVLSSPLVEVERLHPEQISSLEASKVTDTDITLTWSLPRGDYDIFEVQYLNVKNRLIKYISLSNSITIKNLRPFRNYTFSVVTKSGADEADDENNISRRSKPVSRIFYTKESVPGSPPTFEPYEILPSTISFKWDLPVLEANGIVTGFVILYGDTQSEGGSTFTTEKSIEFEPNEKEGTITDLIPGHEYIFQIQARTRIGLGKPKRYTQEMPIWAPPVPGRDIKPTEFSKSTETVVIKFHQRFFSDENGEVIAYAVIVAEDYTKPTENKQTLLKWQDVQSYRTWPPYQVSDPYNPFHNKSTEVFSVGTEDCKNKVGYCNGPLKPGSTYRFKLRAYTTRKKFSETNWSDEIQTDPDNTAFLVGIIIPIIILMLFIIFILILRRLKYYRSGSSCLKRRIAERDMRHNDNVSLPDSVMETSKPVKLKDFAEHYRIMSADSDFRFSEEYEELKHVGREKSCSAADLPINRPKNRFTNILPYDHSRVKLQPTDDEEGSDYINANFVPGFNSPREFVVTQGCLHSTRDDFWRMCWETNSRAIVMLTRCIEKGREKCDHYWPYDTQPVYYGDIQVTILNESHFPDWNISEFRMMRGDTVRSIKHFHFTTWPDFGVPDPPQTLVRFVRAFRERISAEQRPIVVHCSAGVGRSGTFIALDRILQVIRHSDVVDIFGIVYEMRKERVWMVQTEQQYISIHQCLLAVLEGKENDPAIHEIHDNEGFEDDEGIVEPGM